MSRQTTKKLGMLALILAGLWALRQKMVVTSTYRFPVAENNTGGGDPPEYTPSTEELERQWWLDYQGSLPWEE